MKVHTSLAVGLVLTGFLTSAGTLAGQVGWDKAQGSSAGELVASDAAEAPSPPVNHVARYVIPYYTSQTLLAGSRSVTMVDVYNQSAQTCEVSVQFQFASGTTNACTITLSVPAKQSRLFCSRSVGDPVFPCTISCPGVGLIFNTGHAFISSTNDNNGECGRIAAHAQLAFTRDLADDQLEATTKLSVVKLNYGNDGD